MNKIVLPGVEKQIQTGNIAGNICVVFEIFHVFIFSLIMDDQDSVKNKIKIDKNILDLFWKLCENDSQVRINASANILRFLWKRQILVC